MLDVPYELVEHVSWLIYARRRELNSPWQRLGCFKQTLLVLAHLRKDETFAQLGAGFAISQATAWRYVDEALDVLAAWAPGPHEALTGLGEGDFVIVDGTLIPIYRIAADEPYYSQKHRQHGMNVQVIARPDGTPLWFSRATPGRTHDLTAARAHDIAQACLTRQILVLADRAYQGAGATVRTPYYRHREQPERYQQFNHDHARLRAPGERAFAQLKAWRLLRRTRMLHPPHQHHRPSRPHTADLQLSKGHEPDGAPVAASPRNGTELDWVMPGDSSRHHPIKFRSQAVQGPSSLVLATS